MENADRQTEHLARRAALRFVGSEAAVREQFNIDTEVPRPPAPAPPVLYDVLEVLYQNSQLFLGVFATVTASLLAYFLGRRAAKRDQEELVHRVREMLDSHQEQIRTQLEANRKLQSKLRWHPSWVLWGLTDRRSRARWQLRLTVYADKAELLLNTDEAIPLVIEAVDEAAQEDPAPTPENPS